MRSRTIDEAVEEVAPERELRVERVLARGLEAAGDRGGAGGGERLSERLCVLDVDEPAVLAVPDQLGCLPDAGGDDRHAARHRLENPLRPALLPRRHGIRIERLVEEADLVVPRELPMDVRDAEPLEAGADEAARRPRQEDVHL